MKKKGFRGKGVRSCENMGADGSYFRGGTAELFLFRGKNGMDGMNGFLFAC